MWWFRKDDEMGKGDHFLLYLRFSPLPTHWFNLTPFPLGPDVQCKSVG